MWSVDGQLVYSLSCKVEDDLRLNRADQIQEIIKLIEIALYEIESFLYILEILGCGPSFEEPPDRYIFPDKMSGEVTPYKTVYACYEYIQNIRTPEGP